MTKFKPGESGNPRGKKPGTLNKRSQLAKLFEPYAEALVTKAVELALEGDSNALRLCVERLIPKASEKSLSIVLPDIKSIPIERYATEILHVLAGQEISLLELKHIIDIANYSREHDDHTKQEANQRINERVMELLKLRDKECKNIDSY